VLRNKPTTIAMSSVRE